MLSDAQFEGLAAKLNDPDIGGFTANMRRGGEQPRNVFMVGQRDVQEGTHALPSTGSSIRTYAEANQTTLMQPGRHLGGWAGNEGNLDVPAAFPRTPRGEVAARRSTLANEQMAYGEISRKGAYVGDRNNPYHPGNRRGDIMAEDTPEQREVWSAMPQYSAQFKKRGRRISPQSSFS